MLSRLRNKLVDLLLAVDDRGASLAARLGLGRLPAWVRRPFSKPAALVCLELFVAVCLTVNFFYLVRTQCIPKRDGNAFSSFSFVYLWDREPVVDVIPVNWRTRLVAPILSSWYMESQFSPARYASLKKGDMTFGDVCRTPDFQNVFGFYHAAWLCLVFLSLICFRRDALFIMLGVFAGLMYNFAEPSGMYYYSWDMPALFFFTLCCLLFDKGWIGLLLPAVIAGSLFKETILCCSLFVLLGAHWNWTRRIAGFLAVLVASFGLNRLILSHYGTADQVLALNGAAGLNGLSYDSLLFKNLRSLFGPDPYHVIFVNAGALLLVLSLPWRNRRDLVFKLVIGGFAIGQLFYGVITEVRIWYEVLPVGWLLVSETVSRRWPLAGEVSPTGDSQGPANRLWPWIYWVGVGSLLAALFTLFVSAKLNAPPEKSNEAIIQELTGAAKQGDPLAQYQLGQMYEAQQAFQDAANWYLEAAKQGHRDAQYALGDLLFNTRKYYEQSAEWFGHAADLGHVQAQYRFGSMLWNGQGTNQDIGRAINYFVVSAQQGELHSQWLLGKIYLTGNGVNVDLVKAYFWSKLAALQGHSEARQQMNACLAKMTPKQVAEAEQQVKKFLKSRNNTPAGVAIPD